MMTADELAVALDSNDEAVRLAAIDELERRDAENDAAQAQRDRERAERWRLERTRGSVFGLDTGEPEEMSTTMDNPAPELDDDVDDEALDGMIDLELFANIPDEPDTLADSFRGIRYGIELRRRAAGFAE